jgi:hypothetical protein
MAEWGWIPLLCVIAVDFLILFQPFIVQLSTLSSFHFPLSPYESLKALVVSRILRQICGSGDHS